MKGLQEKMQLIGESWPHTLRKVKVFWVDALPPYDAIL